jgi:hypothetical protein
MPSPPNGSIAGQGILLTMNCPGSLKTFCEPHQGRLRQTEIAVAIMQAKGMPPGDGAFKEIVANRALTVLRRLAKLGTVIKHGTSRDAQWALAHQFAGVSEF